MVLNKCLTYILLTAVIFTPSHSMLVSNCRLNTLPSKPRLASITKSAEGLLVKSLLEITQGNNQQALNTINELIKKIPNFKLAYLIRGDLLMAKAQPLQSFGNATGNQTEAIQDFQAEARVRIKRYLSNQSLGKLPDLLLVPNPQQRHLIVVDTDKSRLYLYKNDAGHLRYVTDYYVTIGKNGVRKQIEGDKRTPIGVYYAKRKLTQPLADMYGKGAYPLNYPNEWDILHNRNGSGIWLHGTPSTTYSRPPNASNGCVVLTNQDLEAIAAILQTGKTPVIIANHLKWTTANSRDADKNALQMALNDWLNDWRLQDTPKYLSHYSSDFSSDGMNFKQWADRKFIIQANKPKVSINISNISMFTYPEVDKKLVLVDFVQDFKSTTLSNKMQKRQYWIQENHSWKIIYEGAA